MFLYNIYFQKQNKLFHVAYSLTTSRAKIIVLTGKLLHRFKTRPQFRKSFNKLKNIFVEKLISKFATIS